MKKTPKRLPLCAAALLALSGSAYTQTSGVTLVGTIDVGVGQFKTLGPGVNATHANLKQVINGPMSTSWWGLRGSEDLGGGLSAIFELGSFFRADTGALGRSDAVGAPVNVAADTFWARNAWVGFQSASLGRLRLGNSASQMWFQSLTSNAFGDSTLVSPLNVVTFIGSPLSGGTGWTNQIIVDTPRIGGFVFTGAVSAGEGQNGRNSGWRAAYSNGPLALSIAGQDVKKNPLTFADGTSPNNTRAWQLAASYDFKFVKLWAHAGSIENHGTETAPLDITYRIWEASAAVPLGAGKLLAGYAQRKTDDAVGPVPATAGGGNVERKILSVGYDHDLSKRTDAYAMVMNDKTVTNTLPAPGQRVSASGTGFVVGVRHRF